MYNVFTAGSVDHPTPEAAIEAVEAAGKQDSVTLFHVTRNRPGCLPEFVHRSCAMWAYDGSKWYRYSIDGGTAERLNEEKPHL